MKSSPKYSYRVYTIPVLFLAGAGLIASLYLFISHYRNYTDIAYSSFCAISKAINCDTVSQSSWSVLFGIPLAIWGTFAYALFFLLALPAQINSPERRGLWDILFVLALIYSLSDIVFGYVSAFEINAYCIMCLFTYAVSFSLLFSAWIIRRRFASSTSFLVGMRLGFSFLLKHKLVLSALCLLMAALIGLKIFLPTYWIYEYPALSTNVHTGITEEGHPWIGAEQPSLVINEFTDYQCFQCSKMHFFLRLLVNKHPDSIRLIHHHYPLNEIHPGSNQIALLAIASANQGKFWQVNDSLYAIIRNGIKEFNINKFAKKSGLNPEHLKRDMYSQAALKQLESDMRSGMKNKITGTPAFLIDGKVYQGNIPSEILKKVAELPKK
ncbi:thioredoxin domain-containing protein [Desulfobulbus sp. F4]|nr:thioredoxin domain-containing protein [Desulfobulbus sp. F3]MCW5200661.1 thioredoxin domain-containing protein [Desulfobulbus sp. F4]